MPETGFPGIYLLKLSEKGFEQRSGREFGWFTEGEMGRKDPFWASVGLHRRPILDFSDGFSETV